MRKKLLSILFALGAFEMYAQVGVGTEVPNISSQLDVVANNKGILIPRVRLIDTKSKKPIVHEGTLPNGLIVFNTGTSGKIPNNVSPGLYYWYEGSWNRMISPVDIRTPEGTVLYDPEVVALTYIDQQGDSRIINIDSLVKSNETITTLVKNLDGSYTYTNEAGVAKRIDFVGDSVVKQFDNEVVLKKIESLIKEKETLTSLTYDPVTHVLKYKPENGEPTSIDLTALVNSSETITALSYDANAHTLIYKAEDGNKTSIDLTALVNRPETITTLSYDTNAHTITYSAEDGNNTIIDLAALANRPETITALSYDANAHTLVYKAEDGNKTSIDLAALVNRPETITTLSYDANAHTITYRAEDGNNTIIDLTALVNKSETITTLSYDANAHTLVYKAEDGNKTSIDLAALANRPETITTLSYDTNAHTITYRAEDGNNTVIDLTVLANKPETITALSYDANAHTITYSAEDGNNTIIDLTALVNRPETITALSYDNDAHTLIYKAEDGNKTNIDLNTLVKKLESKTILSYDDSTYTLKYKSEEGTATVIDLSDLANTPESLTSLVYDEDNKVLVYTDEQGESNRISLSNVAANPETTNGSPWFVTGGDTRATSKTENIYHTGNVGIGGEPAPGAALGVTGSVNVTPKSTDPESKVSLLVGKGNSSTGANALVNGASNTNAADNTAIIGGKNNTITDSGESGVIVGGAGNRVNAVNSTIVGSKGSTAEGNHSLILGGAENTAPSAYETVLGKKATPYTPVGGNDEWNGDDRLFTIGNGVDGVSSNAITILKNGNTGFKNAASEPTETIDVGVGKVRIRQIQNEEGSSNDRVVVADAQGVLRTIDRMDLGLNEIEGSAIIEPWNLVGTDRPAKYNSQNIYHSGAVSIGFSTGNLPSADRLKLNVWGAFRAGTDNNHGDIGSASAAFGQRNRAEGYCSFVTGTGNEIEPRANSATIVGGEGNIIRNGTNRSGVFGGYQNTVNSIEGATIVGGKSNLTEGSYSTVVGGFGNVATSYLETVVGSYANKPVPHSKGGWDWNDRLFVVGNGVRDANRSDAMTILKNGKIGLGNNPNPTEVLDINGNLRLRNIYTENSGTVADKLVFASSTGVLKTMNHDTFLRKVAQAEPWQVMGGTVKASSNTENIYQMGNVGIGISSVVEGVRLNVNGAVRIGAEHEGPAGRQSLTIGYLNRGEGNFSFVDGQGNINKGVNSFVGGNVNTNERRDSFIYGENNKILGKRMAHAFVFGQGNVVKEGGYFSAVLGGMHNTMNRELSFIVGGHDNIAMGMQTMMLNGIDSRAEGDQSIVLGGNKSVAKSYREIVIGGNTLDYTVESSYAWRDNDRLLVVGNGKNEDSRSNAITVLKNGNIGFKNQAAVPTETIDVGSGNVRIRDINASSGGTADKIVVASPEGVLKTIDRALLGGQASARSGLSNNIEASNVRFSPNGLGISIQPEESLDVGTGRVRIRQINELKGDKQNDRIVVATSEGVLKTIDASEFADEENPIRTANHRSVNTLMVQFQEQQKLLEQQNTEINTLKQKLQQMEEKLEALVKS